MCASGEYLVAGLAGPLSLPGHGLLQVLAWPVVSGRVVEVDVPGYVGCVDGAQRGRILELGIGCDPAGLADGGLVEQPDGQAGVAGAVAGFGLGEDVGGLACAFGGEGEPGLAGQVAKMAASCMAV